MSVRCHDLYQVGIQKRRDEGTGEYVCDFCEAYVPMWYSVWMNKVTGSKAFAHNILKSSNCGVLLVIR